MKNKPTIKTPIPAPHRLPPAGSPTPCHSGRGPAGTKRRNLFKHPQHRPKRPSSLLRLLPAAPHLLPSLPSLPRIHESFMQNKPNLQSTQIATTSCSAKSYTNTPPRSPQKNKPKQTQSRRAGSPRDTQHEIRDTKQTPVYRK